MLAPAVPLFAPAAPAEPPVVNVPETIEPLAPLAPPKPELAVEMPPPLPPLAAPTPSIAVAGAAVTDVAVCAEACAPERGISCTTVDVAADPPAWPVWPP